MICDDCGNEDETVKHRPPMTAYHWNGEGKDPNDSGFQCDECWKGYKDYWDSMWDEYRSSQGF